MLADDALDGRRLDSIAVVEPTIAAEDQCPALTAFDTVEDRLDEVFKVVGCRKTDTFSCRLQVPGR
jgi:hypothetical protein